MRKSLFVVMCFLLGALASTQGRAQSRPLQPGASATPATQAPIVTSCWREPRYFSSLKTGDVEYCRGHMKYTAGALDCYTFETEVCWVFLPHTNEWTQIWQELPPTVVECPEGPKPPLCPQLPHR